MSRETDEWINQFKEQQRRRGLDVKTVAMRTRHVRKCLSQFATIHISRRGLEEWIKSQGVVDTQRSYLDSIRQFYEYAVQCEWVKESDNPTKGIDLPRQEKVGVAVPSEAEIEHAIANAKDRRVGCWIALAAYQGLRSKDIAGLRREEVDLESVIPRLNLPKSGQGDKTAILHRVVIKALDMVILSSSGRLFEVTDGQVSKSIQRALRPNGNQRALTAWYQRQVDERGRNFGRDMPSMLSENGVDPALWAHISRLVALGDWGKVASQTAIFTEDRIRKLTGRRREEVGEKLMTAVFGDRGDFQLGTTEGERQGWHRLAMGISMALRNVDAHRIEDREDHERYAFGVIGASSLLLTQLQFEYGDRLKT